MREEIHGAQLAHRNNPSSGPINRWCDVCSTSRMARMGKVRQREEGTQAFWGINSISAFPLLVRMHEDIAVPPRSSACFLCELCADVAVISRSKHIDCDWWPACRLDCAPAPSLPEAGCASTLAVMRSIYKSRPLCLSVELLQRMKGTSAWQLETV